MNVFESKNKSQLEQAKEPQGMMGEFTFLEEAEKYYVVFISEENPLITVKICETENLAQAHIMAIDFNHSWDEF